MRKCTGGPPNEVKPRSQVLRAVFTRRMARFWRGMAPTLLVSVPRRRLEYRFGGIGIDSDISAAGSEIVKLQSRAEQVDTHRKWT